MKVEKKGSDGRTYTFVEGFWSERRTVYIDGVECRCIDKKHFSFIKNAENSSEQSDETEIENSTSISETKLEDLNEKIVVKGSIFYGIAFLFEDGHQEVIFKNTWYEWFLLLVPFLNVVFGSIIGELQGGILSLVVACLASLANLQVIRLKLPLWQRVLICIGVLLLSFGLWFGILEISNRI